MLNCQQTRRQLESLDFDETAVFPPQVERHLSHCQSCREHWDAMRALQKLLLSQPRVASPPDFETRLRARLRSERRNFRQSPLAWVPTSALAVCAAAALLTAGYAVRSSWQPLSASQPPNPPAVATQPALESNSTSAEQPAFLSPTLSASVKSAPTMVAIRQRTTPRPSPPLKVNASRDKVVLLLRDSDDTERVIHIPSVVYGTRAVINPRNAPPNESSDHSVF